MSTLHSNSFTLSSNFLTDDRKKRLRAFINLNFGGNQSEMGRALGYGNGAFVGQMLSGYRPITEKTIAQIHALPGGSNWFFDNLSSIAIVPPDPFTQLADVLRSVDAPAKERAAVLLQGLARDPDGPWAAWLSELLSLAPVVPVAAPVKATVTKFEVGENRRIPYRDRRFYNQSPPWPVHH